MMTEVNEAAWATETQSTPRRLRVAIDTLLLLPISHIEVAGIEYARQIEKPAIVATSHQTGLDVPLAVKALGDDMDLVVTDQSTHRSVQELSGLIGMKIAGEDNFLSIAYQFNGRKKQPAMFRVDDATLVVDALGRGKSVVTAAYNPVEDGGRYERKPGYSAAYSSLLTGAPVLPVGIQSARTHVLSRSPAAVVIGEPLAFSAEPMIASLQDILNRRNTERLSKNDVAEVAEYTRMIRARGKQLFDVVLSLEKQAKQLLDSKG